jgi:crossover junction endodeoxyribonuclease RuvC
VSELLSSTAIKLVLGIDLGVNGAIAIVGADGSLVRIHDAPALASGTSGRRAINAPLLAEIVANSHAVEAFVEYVGARPGEGAVGAFSFGRSRGVVEGVLAALGLPCTFITSPSWKRIIGIPAGKIGTKDLARAEAIRRWPGQAGLFARVKDDGRGEAALIAIAGMTREARQ